MMDTVKRILAVAALACAAVTLVAFVWVLLMGQLQEKLSWVLVPASAFFMAGLIAIAINWLQKLKADAEKARAQQQDQ